MTIYINARWLLNPPSGVERYAYQITKALLALKAPIVLLCPKHGQIHKAYDTENMTIIRYGIGHSHVWEQLVLPWFFIKKHNYILLSLMGLGSILISKKVMTIHDVSFLHQPSWFSYWYYAYYKLMTPLAIRSSLHIFTVSEFSKSEILRYYSWLEDSRITIAPCAVDTSVFTKGDKPREKFVLAVSSLDPRKNFKNLITALNNTSIPLRIAGNSGRIFSDMHISPASNITQLGYVSEEELKNLYQRASVLVFPSLYEGFGIPPLEAMASGCPVIVSDIPVMHEVCGNAAVYCNPMDIANIQKSIKQVLSYSSEKRLEVVQIGYQNISKYSWISSAKQIYHTILVNCVPL